MDIYKLVVIKVGKREESAVQLQKLLTDFGCNIKVRLGLHDNPKDPCSNAGLIVLQVLADDAVIDDFVRKINGIQEISAKKMEI